jgi:tetratricopeptide (TPR) repeat protein
MLLSLLFLAACSNSSDSLESLKNRGLDHVNNGRQDPKNIFALCARGGTYGGLGKYDEALCDLNAAIPHPVALKNRAAVYHKMRRYEDSLADLKQLLITEPASAESAEVHQLMAKCYSALKDFENAATNYKMVSELEPKNAMARMNYAGMLIELKQYEQADKVISQAIMLKPEDYAGWALRSYARRLAGDTEGEESDRQMAHKLNPEWGSDEE